MRGVERTRTLGVGSRLAVQKSGVGDVQRTLETKKTNNTFLSSSFMNFMTLSNDSRWKNQ